MTDQDKIIDKIRKLLALSQSNNEHEATAAADRAMKLMECHQLGMSDVEIKEHIKAGVIKEEYTVEGLKRKSLWATTLAMAAANAFDGTAAQGRRLHGTQVTFIGNPDDIPAMKMLFEHLYKSWRSFVEADIADAKEAHKVHGIKWAPKDTMKFKQGHGAAFSNRIYFRVKELVAEKKRAMQSATASTALVVQKDQLVKSFLAENGYVTGKLSQSAGSSIGQKMGRKSGDQASLGGAIGDDKMTALR